MLNFSLKIRLSMLINIILVKNHVNANMQPSMTSHSLETSCVETYCKCTEKMTFSITLIASMLVTNVLVLLINCVDDYVF